MDAANQIYISTEYLAGQSGGVQVYAAGVSGSSSPIATITGSATDMLAPGGIAISPTGDIYVAQANGPAVTVYPAGSNGNVVPSTIIYGSNTGLWQPRSLAFDALGYLYVGDISATRVEVFAPGASGNVAPIATIPLRNEGGFGIAVYPQPTWAPAALRAPRYRGHRS